MGIDGLNDSVSSNDAEIVSLTQKLEDTNETIESLSVKLADLERAHDAEHEQLHGLLANTREDINSLINDNVFLVDKLANQDTKIGELQAKIDEQSDAMKNLLTAVH